MRTVALDNVADDGTPPELWWVVTAGTVAAAVAVPLGTHRAAITSRQWISESNPDDHWPHTAARIEDRLDANAAIGAVVSVGLVVLAVVSIRTARLTRVARTAAVIVGVAVGAVGSFLVWFSYLSNADFPTHYLH